MEECGGVWRRKRKAVSTDANATAEEMTGAQDESRMKMRVEGLAEELREGEERREMG